MASVSSWTQRLVDVTNSSDDDWWTDNRYQVDVDCIGGTYRKNGEPD